MHQDKLIVWALKINGEANLLREEVAKTNDPLLGALVSLVAQSSARLSQFIIDRDKRDAS